MARIVISGLTTDERDVIKGACASSGEYVKDVGRRLFLAYVDRDVAREGLDNARAKIKRLRDLLKQLEWVRSDSQDWRSCRICHQFEEHGHKADCLLSSALEEDTP